MYTVPNAPTVPNTPNAPNAPTAPAAALVVAPAAALVVAPAEPEETDPVLGAERTLLRLEFQAIVAAGYRPAAEQPRPVPPARPTGTAVGGARPVGYPALAGGCAWLGRAPQGVAVRAWPRERSPPRPA